MEEPLNQISEKQNTEKFLEYLAAARSLYTRAKKVAGIQMLLTVPFPICLSLIAILNPERRVWSALAGIAVSILDVLIFDKLQKDLRKEAAKAQEQCDCGLFGLEWNDYKIGDRPAPERVHANAQAILKKELKRKNLIDWYSPSVARLPLHLARVVCQRSNIYWDSDIRRRYTAWVTGITLALVVGAVVTGLALKMSMEAFVLSILAPISPTFLWSVREIRKQNESTATLDRLMKCAQQLWKDVLGKKLSPEEATEKSRNLQDEIFSHRHSNQLIFDWIYGLMRTRQEAQMNVGAEALVEEALRSDRR
jgi:hypothetical protein